MFVNLYFKMCQDISIICVRLMSDCFYDTSKYWGHVEKLNKKWGNGLLTNEHCTNHHMQYSLDLL